MIGFDEIVGLIILGAFSFSCFPAIFVLFVYFVISSIRNCEEENIKEKKRLIDSAKCISCYECLMDREIEYRRRLEKAKKE